MWGNDILTFYLFLDLSTKSLTKKLNGDEDEMKSINSSVFIAEENLLFCSHIDEIVKWDLDTDIKTSIYKKAQINQIYTNGSSLILCKENN